MEKLVCPICGDVTSSYMGNYRKDRLCKSHAFDLKNGKLTLCEKCQSFHYVGKPCKCEKKRFTELPLDGFDKCVSCGAETTGYAFCRSCFRNYTEEEMLDILNGENIKSQKNTPEVTPKIKQDEPNDNYTVEENKTIVIDFNNKSKCITCGRQTDGLLFCGSCYHKYKDKELLFKITKCTSIELLDESYEGIYTCKDGHVVKSKSELLIDDYLFDHGIPHAYEAEVAYGGSAKDVLHPDFYLPDYLGQGKDIYIEHWGYNENNIQYTKTKKFKIQKYKEMGITLICTYEKSDSHNFNASLSRKLNKSFINEGQINYEEITSE